MVGGGCGCEWERDCGVGRGWGRGARKVEAWEESGPLRYPPGAVCFSGRCVPTLDSVPIPNAAASGPRAAPSLARQGACECAALGCLEPKAQLPVRYPNSPAEAATLKEGPPNGKRLHHLPRGRTEPLEAPGGPASLFPVRRGPGPAQSIVQVTRSAPALVPRVHVLHPPNSRSDFPFPEPRASLSPPPPTRPAPSGSG